MESINNDYSPRAFATKVMPSATSQRSLINTHKSHKKNKIITQQLSTVPVGTQTIKSLCGLVSPGKIYFPIYKMGLRSGDLSESSQSWFLQGL